MTIDPRRRDPRVCRACGDPVDIDGTCAGIRTMLAGIAKLPTGGESRGE